MPRWTRRLAALVVVAVASATALAQDDGSSHEWNQHRGNAARSACVDVAPIRSQPVIAWRRQLPGELAGPPVTWQGVVYVATSSTKGELSLSAYSTATGEPLASRPVGRAGWADLAVARGTVFFVDPLMARSYRFDGKSLSLGWMVKGSWLGPPALVGGHLLVPDPSSVRVLDAASGRDAVAQETTAETSSVPRDFGAVSVLPAAGGESVVARLLGTASIRLHTFTGLGTRTLTQGTGDLIRNAFHSADTIDDRRHRDAVLLPVGRSWFATYPAGFFAKGDKYRCGSILVQRDGTGFECPIALPAAVVGGKAYGMSADGTAYSVEPDGRYVELTKPGNRPKGTREGPASASGDVVYFGNWAFETDSGRVLWVLRDAVPATPLIPCGDGRALFVDPLNCMVGIAEPERLVPAAADGAPAPAATAPARAPDLPGDADGVLLADGRFVAGRAEIVAGGGVRVTSAAGGSEDVAAGTWALVQQDGKPLPGGEERLVLAAWQEILDRRSAAAWDAVFRKYAEAQLVTEALRALAAAKRDGLSDDRARQLEQTVAGKRDHPNADLQKKRVGPEAWALRGAHLDDVRAASKWCRSRAFPGAAAALLARIRQERPGDGTAERTAQEFLPPGFPWANSATAGDLWIRWAAEVVPAGGEFVPPTGPEALAKRTVPWNQDVVMLRTRNVLLVSRSTEPGIVGDCLRHAEGAIRACERVLGPASASAPDVRMEVRLHANRAEYLAEVTPDGSRADAWSAGYYSPAERVSRFYVPGADETALTPLSRGLLRVLAHEVTHQWIEQRWEPSGRAGMGTPGYWCVEGVARFIEDQSVEMGRREGRLDDATVTSLDIASQVDAANRLTPLAAFLALSHADFEAIPDAPKTEVTLRNTARISIVDPRDLFYEQAGSLVFWLVNRCGDGGRAAFVRYLRQRYRGRFDGPAAAVLGVKSLEEMERAFRAFLAGLRR